MSVMASQITSLTIVYSSIYSGADQRKHQSSASLAFVRGIHRWPVNSPHKGPVTRKMFPFDDVILSYIFIAYQLHRKGVHCQGKTTLMLDITRWWSPQPLLKMAMFGTFFILKNIEISITGTHSCRRCCHADSSSWASQWGSRLYIWYPRKLPLFTISRLWRYCCPSNYRFDILLYWYAPWVFFRSSMCFRVPHLCPKIPIYTIDRWIVVNTVCASMVISSLRQWLDFYTKTRLEMCHTFKHFIHMQYFLLMTNLVIVFVHWVSTGVLYEPRQCSLFWDYIPEIKLRFCVSLCRPYGPYSIRPIQKLLNCHSTTRGGCCSIHPDGEQP